MTVNLRRLAAMPCLVLLAVWGLPSNAAEYPWQKPHAKVIETGDLEWAPESLEYEPLGEIRYIDFEGGEDGNPGTLAAPWKHHPWDPAASGNAQEGGDADTYVFRQGVTYRGVLKVPRGASATLTRDPDWGGGEARFYGSEPIRGGWQQGADHSEIPEPSKVWHVDLDFAPRTLWLTEEGKVTRIPLARDPNWSEPDPQDPMSEWYTWEQPRWWEKTHQMKIDGETYHLGIDSETLTGEAEDYVGGTVWTEWGIVMGSPYPSRIRGYDAEQKGIAFGGPWVWGASEKIITDNRYYLEDLPRFLDSPREFWFDKKGSGGRLYLRLPGDRDPNAVTLEAGRYVNLIDAEEAGDLAISGLTFRFTNTHWEFDIPQWAHPDLRAGVLRLQGSAENVEVTNNRFEHVHLPVRITVPRDGGHVGTVTIADNLVRHTDHGAFHVKNQEGKTITAGRGHLDRVDLLRNKLYHIGWRVLAGAHGHAISVQAVTRAHVAGNMLDRVAGWGISVSGGKRHPAADVPFVRDLVHHNRVEDCLLKSCDWGAFYITQGGPHYVYNNVAVNPVGQMNWAGKRLGYAYYMDGGYKGYLFNNIAVGRPVEKGHERRTAAAVQSMISFQNIYFNNTAYQFKAGSRRQAPQGGREKYLANIFQDIGDWVFRHAKPADSPEAANAAHLPEEDAAYPYETNAYSHNILYDIAERIGVFETHGMPYTDFAAFAGAVENRKTLAADVGVIAERSPLRNPAEGDFRPAPKGAAIDYGARVFVPWSLHGMVGEWNFTINRQDPARILDEHWYMTPYYVERSMYRKTPRYDLTGSNIDAGDYLEGPLENWTEGALSLNGTDQYAVLTHEEIAAPFAYEAPVGKGKTEETTVAGRQKRTVDIGRGNFLVEVYLRIEEGDDGVLVRKADQRAGYVLEVRGGSPRLRLLAEGRQVASLAADADIADGRWHHLIAEVDRSRADGATIYVDGTAAGGTVAGAVPRSSLANEADFLVGGGPGLDHLACTLDFLRVARGTLADAETTIEELYGWQFDGPQFRDFAGRKPFGARDAGAVEQSG